MLQNIPAAPKIIKGNVLMLFIKQNESYHALAFARNHELQLEYDKDEVHSRLDGKWSNLRLTTSKWSITSENLYSEGCADYLTELYEEGTPITVMFGLTSDYNENGIVDTNNEWSITNGYRGKAIITSIDIQATTNEIATLSMSLKGVSSLKKVNASDPDDESQDSPSSKITPTLQFTNQSNIAQYSSSNEYTLSNYTSLDTNLVGKPIRFIVKGMNATLI